MFETLVNPQVRDTLVTDSLLLEEAMESEDDDGSSGIKEEPIDNDIRTAFSRKLPQGLGATIPQKAKFLTHIKHHGISYTVNKRHKGNSSIFLIGTENVPFSIEKIICFSATTSGNYFKGTWCVVRKHQPAKVDVDPYIAYPHLRAGLWDCQLEPFIDVVPVSDIQTHFANCVIPWEEKEYMVAISLSRVRCS